MIKLALVGKGISHSRSQAIYEKLLKTTIQYDLLDYPSPGHIPQAKGLLSVYQGVSITSPYKDHFISQVKVEEACSDLGAINCLYKKGHALWGANTDFEALEEIFDELFSQREFSQVLLLGTGAMGRITENLLSRRNQPFFFLSRKELSLFSDFSEGPILVINACLRGAVFQKNLPPGSLFYDYNYDNPSQEKIIKSNQVDYLDGLELLERQAQKGIPRWGPLI